MTEFKVGDRVTLTGEGWTYPNMKTGDVKTIVEVDDTYLKFVDGEWVRPDGRSLSIELNTDTIAEHFAKQEASSFEQSVRRHTGRIANLLIEKNKQYSNSALDPIRVFSKADRTEQLRVRADDKLSRIRNGDTSEDAVLDLCGYLILLRIAAESE